jgi:hypothetical protein
MKINRVAFFTIQFILIGHFAFCQNTKDESLLCHKDKSPDLAFNKDLFVINSPSSNPISNSNEVTNFGDPRPGDELIKYSRHYYTGFALCLSGYALTIAGAVSAGSLLSTSSGSSGEGTGTILIVAGGIITLIGEIFQLESHHHVGKAGKLLNKGVSSSNRIKFNPTTNGVGLAINLTK